MSRQEIKTKEPTAQDYAEWIDSAEPEFDFEDVMKDLQERQKLYRLEGHITDKKEADD